MRLSACSGRRPGGRKKPRARRLKRPRCVGNEAGDGVRIAGKGTPPWVAPIMAPPGHVSCGLLDSSGRRCSTAIVPSMELEVRWLGRLDYQEAWDLQHELVVRRAAGEVPDHLLLVEHQPVLTLGRQSDPAHIRVTREELA